MIKVCTTLALACAALGAGQSLTVNNIIPTYDVERNILNQCVQRALDAETPEMELEEIEASLEEFRYDEDHGAQEQFERALDLLSKKKDHLRDNGCSNSDIAAFIEYKWTNLRLQKLNTLYVSQLSPDLRNLRSSTLREARKKASKVEQQCVTPVKTFVNGVDGPQPRFNPHAPGKPGHEDEPPSIQRVENPDLGNKSMQFA